VATTDGVPLFDDQVRGMWPFILRTPSLPDSLSMRFGNSHISILSGNEFWEVDPDINQLRRRVRGPKSLMPHMSVLADDLLGAYTEGKLSNK
jgi:hypothetical protein